jgi:hypothetical protein
MKSAGLGTLIFVQGSTINIIGFDITLPSTSILSSTSGDSSLMFGQFETLSSTITCAICTWGTSHLGNITIGNAATDTLNTTFRIATGTTGYWKGGYLYVSARGRMEVPIGATWTWSR